MSDRLADAVTISLTRPPVLTTVVAAACIFCCFTCARAVGRRCNGDVAAM